MLLDTKEVQMRLEDIQNSNYLFSLIGASSGNEILGHPVHLFASEELVPCSPFFPVCPAQF